MSYRWQASMRFRRLIGRHLWYNRGRDQRMDPRSSPRRIYLVIDGVASVSQRKNPVLSTSHPRRRGFRDLVFLNLSSRRPRGCPRDRPPQIGNEIEEVRIFRPDETVADQEVELHQRHVVRELIL